MTAWHRFWEQRASMRVARACITEAVRAGIPLDAAFIEHASSVIHARWIERNKVAVHIEKLKRTGPQVLQELTKLEMEMSPYEALPEEIKEKDRIFVRQALAADPRQS